MAQDAESAYDDSRYSALQTPIPPNLRARLQAVAAVRGQTVAELLETWLVAEVADLDDAQKEVADRLASAALHSDLGPR